MNTAAGGIALSKQQREPFREFAKLERGIPSLIYYRNPKTAHVHWGDGAVRDYPEFDAALDSDGLSRELHEIFQRHIGAGIITSNRTKLSYGGVHGCITYAPHALAKDVHKIVRDYFMRALEIVATRTRERRTTAAAGAEQ